jgi:hypothetical protein
MTNKTFSDRSTRKMQRANRKARKGMISGEIMILRVPFKEKDDAKKFGAKWNSELKVWYVSKTYCGLANLIRWIPAGYNMDRLLENIDKPRLKTA